MKLHDALSILWGDDNHQDNYLVNHIHQEKYAFNDEVNITDSLTRVSESIMSKESEEIKEICLNHMLNREFNPGGRIHAGAGTDMEVTLINCFVVPPIRDSMKGIFESLQRSAIIQQKGGGIGVNFSTLRPKGAYVKGVNAASSGPISFMDLWNSMCSTIMSSGSRRGAMLASLSDWHPDILEFINAKKTKGRLTNFNVSILISDKFMEAVKNDEDWHLFHIKPLKDKDDMEILHDHDVKMFKDQPVYIYNTLKARELWDKIISTTYEYSEPGILFIDRINNLNNLHYAEEIISTNPCGEQPLPANGNCDLGAVNLAMMIDNPFLSNASINYDNLKSVVHIAVRFLDNVLDKSKYPFEDMREEALSKRRIGLGITGLANMFMMLGIRYGSSESVSVTSQVMRFIAKEAYLASSILAREKGPFPLYDEESFLESDFIKRLQSAWGDVIPNTIRDNGIRNGVLLTIAPTGTTSIYYGNISSGEEPVFSLEEHTRNIRQSDGSFKPVTSQDFGIKLYRMLFEDNDDENMPSWMVSAQELTIQDHLVVHEACQEWVDASISKTINCPPDITFEEFRNVYTKAYDMGFKGCTTYRPSDVRGSILEVKSNTNSEDKKPVVENDEVSEHIEEDHSDKIIQEKNTIINQLGDTLEKVISEKADMESTIKLLEAEIYDFTESASKPLPDGKTKDELQNIETIPKRKKCIEGSTYKIRWPNLNEAFYITINNDIDKHGKIVPFEIFINSKSTVHVEWVTAVTRLISAIFRKGGDHMFLIEELIQIHSSQGGIWEDKKYIPSLLAKIGFILKEHFEKIKEANQNSKKHVVIENTDEDPILVPSFWTDMDKTNQSFITTNIEEKSPDMNNLCPNCSHLLEMKEGCKSCPSCFWSKCE